MINDNPILEYWQQISTGQIKVCKKIYLTYQKIINDLNDTSSQYYYNPKRANHAIDFVEKYCCHSKGKLGGKKIKLELWQKALIATTFGFVDIEGNRKYHRLILIIPKKNGKSLLASALGLYLMIADNEAGAEVYAVSTKKEQSKIIWGEAKRMVKKSPALRKRIKCLVGELNSETNDSVFRPLASDSDSLDGTNNHGVLMDELHQWKNGKALYDIMVDGCIAREQPLIVICTTAGIVRKDIYDLIYEECERIINGYAGLDKYTDDRTIPFIYELDDIDEWKQEENWIKANPNIDVSFKKSYLEEKVNQAIQNIKLVKNLLCKHFDMPQTGEQSMFSYDTLCNKATYDIQQLRPKYGIVGLDLSSTTDLTCASILFRVPDDEQIYFKQMYWIPADKLEEKIAQDKIPYDEYVADGYLRLSEGNKINYKDVTAWLLEINQQYGIYYYKIGYDRAMATYLVEDLENNFGQICEPIAQGPITFNIPLRTFCADMEKKIINYNYNPLTLIHLCNVNCTIDSNNNMYICKQTDQTKRIDGVASMLDAYILYLSDNSNYMAMVNY